MKNTILLLVAVFLGSLTVAAQDLIVKKDATKIEAKVTEISADAIRYKRFSNPDGPTYVLAIAEIDYILYANGEKEQFAKPATPATPVEPAKAVTPATPAKAAAPAQAAIPATPLTPATPVAPADNEPASRYTVTSQTGPQYVLKRYAVGDIYDYNGLKGIVYQVSEDGLHGMLLSLDEIYLHWSEFRKPDLRLCGIDDRSNGAANMEKVAAYIAANNLTWDDFPAFKWCREQGEGWYLPSIDEMLNVGHNYNGGSRVQGNRLARTKFNDTLKDNGGKRMDRLVYYFSSTEMDEKNAYTTHMGIEPPYVIEIPKNNKFLVRAVHPF